MILEDLMPLIYGNVEIRDMNNSPVVKCDDTDGIPPFLNECEVTAITGNEKATIISIDFDNFTKALDFLQDRLNGIKEDISDTYYCDTIYTTKKCEIDNLMRFRDEIHQIINNLQYASGSWDDNLDL